MAGPVTGGVSCQAPLPLARRSRGRPRQQLYPAAIQRLLFSQADLDLGNYERFLDISLSKDNNLTTGKIYQVRAGCVGRRARCYCAENGLYS